MDIDNSSIYSKKSNKNLPENQDDYILNETEPILNNLNEPEYPQEITKKPPKKKYATFPKVTRRKEYKGSIPN